MHIKKKLLIIMFLIGVVFFNLTPSAVYADSCEIEYSIPDTTQYDDGANTTTNVKVWCKGKSEAYVEMPIDTFSLYNIDVTGSNTMTKKSSSEIDSAINSKLDEKSLFSKESYRETLNQNYTDAVYKEKEDNVSNGCETIIEKERTDNYIIFTCEDDPDLEWRVPASEEELTEDQIRAQIIAYKLSKLEYSQDVEEYFGRIRDRSILTDFINLGLKVELTDGSFLSNQEEIDRRYRINTEILSGELTEQNYSLYDRFGMNLSFVPYYGETSVNITLFDHLYSAYAQGKLSDVEITDLLSYQSNSYLGTTAYEGRAEVLNSELLDLGLTDPRVSQFKETSSAVNTTGIDAIWGNLYLNISKLVVRLTTFLIGNEIVNAIADMVEYLETSHAWTVVRIAAGSLLSLGMIALVISLAKHSYKFVFKGEHFGAFLRRFLEGILCAGLIALLLLKPTSFNFFIKTISTEINDLFLNTPLDSSDDASIISTLDTTSRLSSEFFNIAILEPWSQGMFGYSREEMNTQFSDEEKKFEQSYQNADKLSSERYHSANVDGTPTYDSAGMTGDVYVSYIKDGKEVKSRNWVDYAWSTTTKFHIDSKYQLEDDTGTANVNIKDIDWPNATQSYGNGNIYTDSFRWVDAKLNISPQYGLKGKTMNNYQDSRQYTQHFKSAGFSSIGYSILLLLLWPAAILKLKNFFMLILVALQAIVYSIYGLFVENGLGKLTSNLSTAFKNYVYNTIRLYIMILLYTILIKDINLLKMVIYIVACISLYSISMYDLKRRVKKSFGVITGKYATGEDYDMQERQVTMWVNDAGRFRRMDYDLHDNDDNHTEEEDNKNKNNETTEESDDKHNHKNTKKIDSQIFANINDAAKFIKEEHMDPRTQNAIAYEIYRECSYGEPNMIGGEANAVRFRYTNEKDNRIAKLQGEEDKRALHESLRKEYEDQESN